MIFFVVGEFFLKKRRKNTQRKEKERKKIEKKKTQINTRSFLNSFLFVIKHAFLIF